MTVEIGGIRFNHMPNSLSCVDGALTISCTDEEEQGFSMYTTDLARFSEVFERFNCVSLGISAASNEEGPLDLDAIPHADRIRRFEIAAEFFPVEVVFSEKKVYFPSLRELWISGKCPSKFPSLDANSLLTKLTVSYDRHFLVYWNKLEQLRDIAIYDCSEADIRLLHGLRGLERLKLVRGSLKSLAGLDRLPKLETLIIVKAPKLVNLDAIVSAPVLCNLQLIQYTKVTDWSFLARSSKLQRLALDVVDSIDFREELPELSFFYVRKVKTRNNKSFLFETDGRYGDEAARGTDINYIPDHDVFLVPLK